MMKKYLKPSYQGESATDAWKATDAAWERKDGKVIITGRLVWTGSPPKAPHKPRKAKLR